MIYFIGDTHFGHTNVLTLDNRDFPSIQDHDDFIITNWNETIRNNDDIYFLGDFSLSRKSYTEQLLKSLNGRKHFIVGNHDKKDTIKLYKQYGEFLGNYHEFKIKHEMYVLCHYPFYSWKGMYVGAVNIHGHSHRNISTQGRRICVSANVIDYKPISLESIQNIMMSRKLITSHDKEKSYETNLSLFEGRDS